SSSRQSSRIQWGSWPCNRSCVFSVKETCLNLGKYCRHIRPSAQRRLPMASRFAPLMPPKHWSSSRTFRVRCPIYQRVNGFGFVSCHEFSPEQASDHEIAVTEAAGNKRTAVSDLACTVSGFEWQPID